MAEEVDVIRSGEGEIEREEEWPEIGNGNSIWEEHVALWPKSEQYCFKFLIYNGYGGGYCVGAWEERMWARGDAQGCLVFPIK